MYTVLLLVIWDECCGFWYWVFSSFLEKNNIQQMFQKLHALLREEFSNEDLQIIACPSMEQVYIETPCFISCSFMWLALTSLNIHFIIFSIFPCSESLFIVSLNPGWLNMWLYLNSRLSTKRRFCLGYFNAYPIEVLNWRWWLMLLGIELYNESCHFWALSFWRDRKASE